MSAPKPIIIKRIKNNVNSSPINQSKEEEENISPKRTIVKNIEPTRKIVIRKKYKTLSILPHQVKWYNRINDEILTNGNKIYIDKSEMRSGKSYISANLAVERGLKLFVIGTVTSNNDWIKIKDEYGLKFAEIITYDSFRGRINSDITHDWFERVITDKTLDFYPSDKFKKLVKDGVLFILDEAQNVKNESIQYYACKSLIDYIKNSNSKSLVGILSGSILNKEKSAVQFLNIIGYLNGKNTYIYDKSAKYYNFNPTNELIEKCKKLDKEKTEKITEAPLNKLNCTDIVFSLFTDVILPRFSGSCLKPKHNKEDNNNNNIYVDKGNGFYNLTGQDNKKLEKAVSDLEKAIEYVTERNQKLGRGQAKHLTTNIQVAKVGIFSRVAFNYLNEDINCKIILCLDYRQPIRDLTKIFEKYDPIVITGDTKGSLRADLINSFNNDPNKRILIGITRVLAYGINLSDTVGNSPRIMLIAADYMVTNIYQAASRIDPIDLKSKAIVRIVYGKNTGDRESKMLKTLESDSKNMRRIMDAETSQDILLPGEYQNFYEEDNTTCLDDTTDLDDPVNLDNTTDQLDLDKIEYDDSSEIDENDIDNE